MICFIYIKFKHLSSDEWCFNASFLVIVGYGNRRKRRVSSLFHIFDFKTNFFLDYVTLIVKISFFVTLVYSWRPWNNTPTVKFIVKSLGTKCVFSFSCGFDLKIKNFSDSLKILKKTVKLTWICNRIILKYNRLTCWSLGIIQLPKSNAHLAKYLYVLKFFLSYIHRQYQWMYAR